MKLENDKPENDPREDLLGYLPSAELTAKSIKNIQSPDGIVIGIEGQWGSGKTTYINFVRGELRKLCPDLKVIEFKPWLYSGRDELIGAYFRFLNDSSKTIFKYNKAIREAIGEIAVFLTPAIKVSANAVTGGHGGDVAEGIAKKAISCLQADTSLEAQYKKIWDALETAKKPLVVVIDDLDRLEEDEIRAILQLVKTVGNLPYVTYILSYDRDYVETCINEKLPKNHVSYLEKIIQLQIPLPKPTRYKLLSMADKKLNPFFSVIEKNERWQTIAHEGVIPYITKPRDIKRLVNAMTFAHASVGDSIDIFDLVVMEVLRVFDNTLWQWIRGNKDYLFDRGPYSWPVDDADKREDFSKSIGALNPLREQQENVLSILFPKLSKVLKRRKFLGSEPDYKIKNRAGIAVESVYDLYFAQHVFNDVVSKPIIDHFLDPKRNFKDMTAGIRRWIGETDAQGLSRISEFLEAIKSRYQDNSSPVPKLELLDALWKMGDEIVSIDGPPKIFFSRPDAQFQSCLKILLNRLGEDKAYKYLEQKFNNPKYLSINCFVLHRIGWMINTYENDVVVSSPITSVEAWNGLAENMKEPLKKAFQDRSVEKFSGVISAQYLAMKILGAQDASKLLASAYEKSPDYVVKTIKSLLDHKVSGNAPSEYVFYQTDDLKLFDYPLLAEHAERILDDLTDTESKKALEIFIEGVRGLTTAQIKPGDIN